LQVMHTPLMSKQGKNKKQWGGWQPPKGEGEAVELNEGKNSEKNLTVCHLKKRGRPLSILTGNDVKK